ncbi:MAG: AbrB/MazE/SpoVT family DNA-binding domain-containing protein [Rhodospirillales bacterium]|nr:AbrB/MazE/SpoVT family DNA-binding domain-containing protein [Rhodospirillales bacterium]
MSDTLTVRKIGNSHGVILPKAELDKLGVGEGDKLFVVHTPGGLRLTAYDSDFAKAMEAARDFMHRHRDSLRELAK